MPKISHYSLHINCDGAPLKEYDTKIEGRNVTCWIESKAGKTFQIYMKNGHSHVAMHVEIHIDGAWAKGKSIPAGYDYECEGLRVDSTRVKPFQFTNLSLTDDDALLHATQKLHKLGSIALEVSKVNIIAHHSGRVTNETKRIDAGPVHERSKKIGVHKVGFADNTMHRPVAGFCTTIPYDSRNAGPVLTVTFLYRSRDFLEAQGIVPRPRAPQPVRMMNVAITRKRPRSPSRQEVDVKEEDGINDDEIKRLEEQRAQIDRKLEEARKKRRLEPVKREPSDLAIVKEKQRPFRLSGRDKGVLDLTRTRG